MLKVKNIKFFDSSNKEYQIKQNQLESFPLVGGESANTITTESWNQHGNTPINALMDAYEGELIFVIRTAFMNPEQIAEERRRITNICNPLNGTINMQITLNDDSVFNRDITFVSAPAFPIGLENRNKEWQKVQLLYSANNPFWYSESEILESFQGVEPLFEFPFELKGKETFNGVKSGFVEKVKDSTIENPNQVFRIWQPELPTDMTILEGNESSQAQIDAIAFEGGESASLTTTTSGNRPMFIFRYNVVEILERKYGTGIWEGATTIADKITKANEIIQKLTYRQKGLGEIGTDGNQTTLGIYKPEINSWTTFEYDWTEQTTWGIWTTSEDNIDADGFATFGLTMTPSDGVITNKLICDFAHIEFDLVLPNQGEEFIFGTVIPSKLAVNQGQVDAPVVIEIRGACVNPRIENESTGEFIAFKNLSMDADDVLVIDTTFGQKRVELNNENVFNKLDFASTFFNLEIGDNNIDFSDETGTKETEIKFRYRNLYITI